ncbi:hypothetical protein [Lactobacillus apis]|uniref:Uncharacterized protein n=1 Tax=Lactobacillus apis TaxID=303541 RepID=A0A0F4LN18_9LACO|nr:hypothetical protein [Lactobacillus apis]KJY59703.1 hypothetical protein JF72_15430 [Lactobacillus apis]
MGERTQLFINIEDAKGAQILGTVIHYQWGSGGTMFESAASIARGLLEYDDKKFDQGKRYKNLFEALKKGCNLNDPRNTWLLRQNIFRNIGEDGCLQIDTSHIERAILENELFSINDGSSENSPAEDLKLAYAAKYSDFFRQCDNTFGLMIMDVKLPQSNGNDKPQISFGFGLSESDSVTGFHTKWHPVDYDDYLSDNEEFFDDYSIYTFEEFLQSNDIKLLSADDLSGKLKN